MFFLLSSTYGMEVEIISEEYIKPVRQTPDHLRMYEVSVLDQIHNHIYMPIVFYYPNNITDRNSDKRLLILKESLSETLTSFYPLAGQYMDRDHIDCNDKGVYYLEAKVNIRLFDFLKQPDHKLVHKFLPVNPNSIEILRTRKEMAMVQVNIFTCGGIAIGLSTSHKIMDGYSASVFLKAWAAIASDSSEKIEPSFISPSIFPPNHSLNKNATLMMLPMFEKQEKFLTRRFFFRASSISKLKMRIGEPVSRVIAVTGLIWKCVINNFSKGRKCSSLAFSVNIRHKISSPRIPPNVIGNIIWTTAHMNTPSQCSKDETELGLDSIARRLKDSFVRNLIVLMDTRSGNGVEAWVTLSEDEMAILEHDPALLAFASVNPSPLEIDDE